MFLFVHSIIYNLINMIIYIHIFRILQTFYKFIILSFFIDSSVYVFGCEMIDTLGRIYIYIKLKHFVRTFCLSLGSEMILRSS